MKRTTACIIAALLLLTIPLTSCAQPEDYGLKLVLEGHDDNTMKAGESAQLLVYVCTKGTARSAPDASENYNYSSSFPAVATVDKKGLVTCVSPGNTSIYVGGNINLPDGDTIDKYAIIHITVPSPAKIADVNVIQTQSAAPPITFPEDYTGPKDGTWSIDDPSVASIAGDGRITGLKPGTTTAYFDQNGARVPFSVTVDSLFQLRPASIDAVAGVPQAVGVGYNARYSGDTRGNWASSDPSLVSVDAGGTVKALKNAEGSAVLTYTVAGVSGTVPVTVRPLFTVSMDPAEVYAGTGAQLAARFDPAYAGDTAGTWAADDEAIATVGQDGAVSGVSAGTTAVTFTHAATGLRATREITVSIPAPTPTPSPSPTPKPTPKPSTNPIKLKSTNVTVISGIARLEASGGAGGPYTFSLSSADKAKFSSHGLTLNSDGFINGSPSTGSFTAKVTVKDAKGKKATISVKFTLRDH